MTRTAWAKHGFVEPSNGNALHSYAEALHSEARALHGFAKQISATQGQCLVKRSNGVAKISTVVLSNGKAKLRDA